MKPRKHFRIHFLDLFLRNLSKNAVLIQSRQRENSLVQRTRDEVIVGSKRVHFFELSSLEEIRGASPSINLAMIKWISRLRA